MYMYTYMYMRKGLAAVLTLRLLPSSQSDSVDSVVVLLISSDIQIDSSNNTNNDMNSDTQFGSIYSYY